MCRRVQKIHLSLRLPKEVRAVIVRHFGRFWNLQCAKFVRDLRRMERTRAGPRCGGAASAASLLLFAFCGWRGSRQELGQFSSCWCLGKGWAAAEATAGVIPSRRADKNWSWGRGWGRWAAMWEGGKGDRLLELPGPAVGIASGARGMPGLHTPVNSSRISNSIILHPGKGKGETCSVSALRLPWKCFLFPYSPLLAVLRQG